MLSMLMEIFRGYGVAADCRFPGEGDVALKYLISAAADFEVGAVAVEGLISLRCSVLLLEWPLAVKAPAWALIWSHFFLACWDGFPAPPVGRMRNRDHRPFWFTKATTLISEDEERAFTGL
jgi:hypothetical protein